MNEELDRSKGTLLGLACGDALGTTLEFKTPGRFPPLTDMIGGGSFQLEAGQWTDDTSMALCLAASLIEKESFDPADQLQKYCDWFRNGYNSSTGVCFDIGNATRNALLRFETSHQPYCGDTSRDSAGNGSIMRLAPVPIFFLNDFERSIYYSALSSRTTHAAPQSVSACKYMGGLISGALKGATKEELLSELYCPVPDFWKTEPLDETIEVIANGSFKIKNPPEITGGGYVVETLEAALWAFYHTDTFESGALKVVNLGRDADTTGAVYGQIAGAYYGMSGIPKKWLNKLYNSEMIEISAETLYYLATKK